MYADGELWRVEPFDLPSGDVCECWCGWPVRPYAPVEVDRSDAPQTVTLEATGAVYELREDARRDLEAVCDVSDVGRAPVQLALLASQEVGHP